MNWNLYRGHFKNLSDFDRMDEDVIPLIICYADLRSHSALFGNHFLPEIFL